MSIQAQQQLGLNDLTHLLPLPKVAEVNRLLHTRSNGGRGEILPYVYFQRLPRLVPGIEPINLYQQSLKVVAVRLDPCFIETTSMVRSLSGCQAQIRLVWQPLVIKENSVTTLDAGVHTFYNLSSAEWQLLVQEYLQIKSSFRFQTPRALQVSPWLSQVGYQSQYWQSFSQLLLKRIGAQNLVRITFMNVNPGGNVWAFGAFKVTAGQMDLLPIPGIAKKTQVVVSNKTVRTQAEAMLDVVPRPVGQDLLFLFLNNTLVAKQVWQPEQIQGAVQKAVEFDNTRLHNPGTISCASCHVTRSATLLAKTSFPAWNWKQILSGVQYVGTSDLTNTTAPFLHGDSLRMLGYFERSPVISDRVINDTDFALRLIQK